MSWKYFGLNKELNLSITPLLRKEELAYFANRESALRLLKMYFDGGFPQHILISGKAGIGKTSLVCYEGIPRENKNFVRIDLSRYTHQGQILNRIILDLIEFACRLKIKQAYTLREDFIYQKKELWEESGGVEGGIVVAKGKISTKKAIEKTRKYLSVGAEQMLEKTLVIVNKHLKCLPIIFLDESDHLSESVQDTILSRIEPLLISRRCKIFFSTRKEIEQVFLGDVNSRYRARFTDIISLGPIQPSAGGIARTILCKRLEPFSGKNYQYPFTEETDTFLEDISDGSIRELLRYASYILNEAVITQPSKPIKVDFAIKVLSQKRILAAEIGSREYQIMKILNSTPLSPSDKILQEKTLLKRASLNLILTKLDFKGFVQKINKGKKVLYTLTPKGKWTLKVYELTRL